MNPSELYTKHAIAFVLGSLLLHTTEREFVAEKRALEESLSYVDAEMLAETKRNILQQIRGEKVTIQSAMLQEAEDNIARQLREILQ